MAKTVTIGDKKFISFNDGFAIPVKKILRLRHYTSNSSSPSIGITYWDIDGKTTFTHYVKKEASVGEYEQLCHTFEWTPL
jgi:hypothetical protein